MLYLKKRIILNDHITEVDSFDEFKKVLKSKGGFISAHWMELQRQKIK